MDIATALDFVRANHNGALLTYKRDGSPQLSPNTADVGTDGRIWISSRETAYKVKNLRRDARTSWLGLNDAFYGQWVQIDGVAEIVSLPKAMDWLVAYYRSIRGEHPDWDEYREAMVRDQRLIIAITPERAGPDRSG